MFKIFFFKEKYLGKSFIDIVEITVLFPTNGTIGVIRYLSSA